MPYVMLSPAKSLRAFLFHSTHSISTSSSSSDVCECKFSWEFLHLLSKASRRRQINVKKFDEKFPWFNFIYGLKKREGVQNPNFFFPFDNRKTCSTIWNQYLDFSRELPKVKNISNDINLVRIYMRREKKEKRLKVLLNSNLPFLLLGRDKKYCILNRSCCFPGAHML